MSFRRVLSYVVDSMPTRTGLRRMNAAQALLTPAPPSTSETHSTPPVAASSSSHVAPTRPLKRARSTDLATEENVAKRARISAPGTSVVQGPSKSSTPSISPLLLPSPPQPPVSSVTPRPLKRAGSPNLSTEENMKRPRLATCQPTRLPLAPARRQEQDSTKMSFTAAGIAMATSTAGTSSQPSRRAPKKNARRGTIKTPAAILAILAARDPSEKVDYSGCSLVAQKAALGEAGKDIKIVSAWPPRWLMCITYENYDEFMLPSGETGICLAAGRKFHFKLYKNWVVRKFVLTPEILENIAQHMIVVQSDTTSRFKGMAPGLYILSEDFLTVPYEEDEEDDVAVFVRPEKHLFVVTGSGVLEVELDEEDFSLIEKRHVYKKRRLHELREQEETEINLKDLEVVREKAEGQPLKKTRWFGPAIDEYQVPKGSIAKKKDEERNSFPDDEPFELD